MDYVKLINCMRCGMCLPHCPTYKETFLETASPRGRVALVRKFQEGELVDSIKFIEYVSLCLDCQACASACRVRSRHAAIHASTSVSLFFGGGEGGGRSPSVGQQSQIGHHPFSQASKSVRQASQ